MKYFAAIALMIGLAPQLSYSGSFTTNSNPPDEELSSVELANILLNAQLSSCVSQWRDNHLTVTDASILDRFHSPKATVTTYLIVGDARQGDIITGRGQMLILKTSHVSQELTWDTYSCQVSMND
ncbi:hypothetical protein [Pseudobacteriovorax antillogorgiicola]|uniref:Uncharacterized protein n=1 Tax=Pseudobacteriovorax antillogorgiicola TaxID=1513793 RepID=A0A1Y6CPZ8_9BACT|nr:hypothetical protein [Pseudobacteriovorax antillogorgiicola]TCS43477.1 hypothetical protein EDD56_1365 [Pseudobacteriovorax antillogorgiicola]SMF81290.1 hypothetical protein SAMN06296036_13641 [Pseudobacteriovorax antillogorgiicola]